MLSTAGLGRTRTAAATNSSSFLRTDTALSICEGGGARQGGMGGEEWWCLMTPTAQRLVSSQRQGRAGAAAAAAAPGCALPTRYVYLKARTATACYLQGHHLRQEFIQEGGLIAQQKLLQLLYVLHLCGLQQQPQKGKKGHEQATQQQHNQGAC